MSSTTSTTRSISSSAHIDAAPEVVFRALVDPAQQVRWNTLYVDARLQTTGPIATGSVMHGTFRGTGPATITFEDVVQDRRFTHHSTLRLLGLDVGDFRHRYDVAADPTGSLVTQTVNYKPRGPGRLLAPVIMRSFARRLPVSFAELAGHLRGGPETGETL